MPRKNTRSATRPTSAFHMTTRRVSQSATTAAIAATSDQSPIAVAPGSDDLQVETSDQSSPSSSPASSKKRKASDLDSDDIAQPDNGSNDQTTRENTAGVSSTSTASSRKRKPAELESDDAAATTRENTSGAASSTEPTSTSANEEDKTDDDYFNPKHSHEQWKQKRYWPLYNDKKKVYYESDGNTRYKPGSYRPSQRNSPATGSPRRPARGGRGRGRGGNFGGNGRGRGRGRARAGRDREESPEPPQDRALDEDEKETMKRLKARQLELKRVFNTIGAQQVDILDKIASTDISKLIRKPKAHKSMPEYDDLVAELQDTQDEIQDLISTRYDYMIQQEHKRYEQEKELIGMQFKQRCEQVQEEHLKGLNGDITLLKKAHAHDEDEDRTESGSERDFLPYHHEFPESNCRARGYTSVAVQDEKSFKEYIESSDDHVRQDVISDEIRPLMDLIAAAKRKRQEEIDREKTQNMPALVEEANHRLDMEDVGGYLIPRPLAGHENQAYGLSALADVADFVAQQHPQQNYIFMPLSPGHSYPRNALNFDPVPGHRSLAPAPTTVTQPTAAPAPAPSVIPPPPASNIVPPPPVPAPFHTQPQQQQVPPPPPVQHQRPPPHTRTPSKELQPSFQSPVQQPYQPEARHQTEPRQYQQDVRNVTTNEYGMIRPAPAYPFQMQPQPPPQYSVPPPRPALNVQTSMNGYPPAPSHSRQSSLSTPVTPHMISTGPGQPIAPAPPRPTLPMSMPPSPFRRPSDPPPPYTRGNYQTMRPGPPPSPRSLLPPPPPSSFQQQQQQQQNFIFQPPQQPPSHHAAPPPASLGAAWVHATVSQRVRMGIIRTSAVLRRMDWGRGIRGRFRLRL